MKAEPASRILSDDPGLAERISAKPSTSAAEPKKKET
jgi:hypothetical protein